MFRQQRPSRWVAPGDFSEQVTKAYKAHDEVQSASSQPREHPEPPLLKCDLSRSLTYYEARTHGSLPVDRGVYGRGDTNARKLLGLPDITVETQEEHNTQAEES